MLVSSCAPLGEQVHNQTHFSTGPLWLDCQRFNRAAVVGEKLNSSARSPATLFAVCRTVALQGVWVLILFRLFWAFF